jgi:hypothetical protein
MSSELGRLPASQVGKSVLHDAPEKQMEAVMSQLDQVVTAMKALTAKLDAEGSIDTDYASLISDSLAKIDLHL